MLRGVYRAVLGLSLVIQGPRAPLEFTISAPPSVRVGQPVPIVLRLKNVSDRPVEAHFLGRTIAFDVIVSRENGAVVWRRLEGLAIPTILQIRTLQPGESLEWRETWTQRTNRGADVAPGTYVVRGELPGDDPTPRRTMETRIRIE